MFSVIVASIFLGVTQIEVVREFDFEGDVFEIDQLGNIYALQRTEILKYTNQGDFLFKFSKPLEGNISTFDVSNPQKIVVFFEATGSIYLLDNQLNQHIDPINVFELSERNVKNVCYSINNHLWLYDSFNQEFIRADHRLALQARTGSFSNYLPSDFFPIKMLEKNDKLYVLSLKHGIAVFDIFGSFIKLMPLNNISDFQIIGDDIVFQSENGICKYNPLSFQQNCIEITTGEQAVIRQFGDEIYVNAGEKMTLYR